MITAARTWFIGLSRREQWLVGIAGGLTAWVLLVFGIILPAMSAIDAARLAHDEAVQRRGRIEASVDGALRQKPSGRAAINADIDLVVTQSAAEKGFDLIKSAGSGQGQIAFRIDAARAPALLAWLAELETQGVDVRSVSLRGGASGSLTVDAQLQRTVP
jgi:general secretion pathway protein M